MARATASLVFTRANVTASGTSVAPGTAVPDNCREIVMLNRSANTVLFNLSAAGSALADDGTSGALPPNASLTIRIGRIEERAGGVMDQSERAGSGLAFDTTSGTAIITIIYVCGP